MKPFLDTTGRALRILRGASVLACASAAMAGCAAADKTATTSAGAGSRTSTQMVGMNMGGSTSASSQTPTLKGIKPVPTQVLASATWQGMRITAQAMTAVPFVIFNGTSEKEVKPTRNTSFHLMVMLSDAQTHMPIPYASVWATISKGAKVIYDERQWPMISRYMGPHYGNDVSVPGAGEYHLSLLISPPESARHMEYANVWVKPHRVNLDFHWKPVS